MKRLLVCGILVSLATMTWADDIPVGTRVYQTYDSEQNTTTRTSADYWFKNDNPVANDKRGTMNQNFGMSYAKTFYTNPSAQYWANSVSLLANYWKEDNAVFGTLGVGVLNSKAYLTGDMTAMRFLNKNFAASVGVYGDVVDSVAGLQNGITFTGVTTGLDAYNDFGGLVGSVRQSYYSNSNIQSGWFAKSYVNVADGINVYVSTKQYHNSNPYNGYYYSPNNYARYNLGVGFRKLFDNFTLAGFVEGGQANADSVWSNAGAWRVAIDSLPVRNWTIGAAGGSDINASNNYMYHYLDLHARYTF